MLVLGKLILLTWLYKSCCRFTVLTIKVRVLAFPEDLRGLLQTVGEVVDQVLGDQALGAGAVGRGPPD